MAQKKKASAARTATTASVTLPSSQEENAPLWLISTPSYDGLAVTESSQAGTHPRKSDDVTPKAHGGDPKGSEIVTPGGGSTLNVDSTAIRGECEKALVALRRGNSTKALRLIKEACNRNETSGIAHRVQGHIFMRLASVLEDPNAKLRHFTSALESARKASSLSPQSVEYAHFYAQLLYEAAKDSKGYEDVVRECERALLIENPVDPARESLHNEQQQEGLLTAEARIDHVHQELKSLVQKANISSISTWMKTLGNGSPGEDKLRLVQLRKFENQDVPMEHRVSQPKRPHEVKKVVKTPEERRKEIEVRVAAARLLQQRDTGANNGGTTTTDSPPEDSHEKGSLQKKVERRKSTGGTNARRLSKVLSVDERTDRVREFWHSLTQEKRETLLLVSIRELKEHLTSWKEVGGGLVNSHAASDALSEALEFAQERKIWRFWACCQCGERFATGHLFHQHTSEHIGSLPQHIQKYLLELAQGGEAGEEDVIIQDKLFLNEDFTYLSLDERVVKECESVGEEAAHRPLMKGKEGEPATHTDLQLLWIFGTVEYEFQPSGWKQFREEQGQRGREVYLALEKEFQRLHALCTKKYELVNCGEALNQVERLCVVERNRREHQIHGGTGKTFEMVLKDRQQELLIRGLNARNGGLSGTQESELDAITNVLRDAQTGVVRMLPYDGNLADEDDVEALRMLQEPMHHADSRVEAVISRHREQLSSEVSPLDAKIMKATDDLQKLEIKLRQLAVLDYRAVALPLVKSLLQSRLEGEAEKDAMQKSDAAQEAFLAELAKDQKSVGSKEVENLKQARGKSKEKRKSKDQKKLKDVKRVPSNSELQGESASLELEEVDDPDNWDWTVGDGLNQQQRKSEISLHQTELYKEERKLLEALELQRRVEEETKQKHLDEQERKKQQITQQQIIQPLEDGKDGKGITTGTLSTASGTVHVSLPSIVLPSPLQLLSVQNGYQSPTEEADDQTVLPSDHTKDTLCSHPRGESTRGVSEEQLVTDDDCNKALENVGPMEVGTSPAGKDVVLLGEDGDHLNSVQKKTRGGGSRNRRRRGPRIYAEEGIIANQHAESCKASDPRTLTTQQSALKNNGKLSTVDQSKPLLRQNALRRFGGGPPANGVPLLLLPAPPSFEGSGGHEGKKTLRQLQAEQDDEERFQADLEQAMRQSLDMLTSPPIASISVASSPPTTVSSNGISRDHRAQQPLETGALGSLTRTVVTQPLKEHGEVGKGLRNEIGQYNCFLNVVIQSLWHLRRFREELLANSSMQHAHVGSPCVVCALRNIFLGLNTPVHNTSSSRDAVAPTALRVALSALYSDSDFFQEAQMNDASEVLAVIFECVHKAFVPNSSSDGDSESSTTGGSWDCQGQHPCMAHALFGLDVAEQMNCQSCGLESRHLKYTAFFHNINASALRAAKGLYPGSSMDELLKLVDMNHQLACDTETGGCGRQNHIHHLLHAAPCVFTTVLGWQNGRESFEDISATVDAMDSALDVGVIYRGLEEGLQHRLVSVVCYYGQHYHCFAYNQEHCRWVMFDDSTVKVIGEWRDVTSTCRRGHLQPQVLFYEAVPVLPEAVTTVAVC